MVHFYTISLIALTCGFPYLRAGEGQRESDALCSGRRWGSTSRRPSTWPCSLRSWDPSTSSLCRTRPRLRSSAAVTCCQCACFVSCSGTSMWARGNERTRRISLRDCCLATWGWAWLRSRVEVASSQTTLTRLTNGPAFQLIQAMQFHYCYGNRT